MNRCTGTFFHLNKDSSSNHCCCFGIGRTVSVLVISGDNDRLFNLFGNDLLTFLDRKSNIVSDNIWLMFSLKSMFSLIFSPKFNHVFIYSLLVSTVVFPRWTFYHLDNIVCKCLYHHLKMLKSISSPDIISFFFFQGEEKTSPLPSSLSHYYPKCLFQLCSNSSALFYGHTCLTQASLVTRSFHLIPRLHDPLVIR